MQKFLSFVLVLLTLALISAAAGFLPAVAGERQAAGHFEMGRVSNFCRGCIFQVLCLPLVLVLAAGSQS